MLVEEIAGILITDNNEFFNKFTRDDYSMFFPGTPELPSVYPEDVDETAARTVFFTPPGEERIKLLSVSELKEAVKLLYLLRAQLGLEEPISDDFRRL